MSFDPWPFLKRYGLHHGLIAFAIIWGSYITNGETAALIWCAIVAGFYVGREEAAIEIVVTESRRQRRPWGEIIGMVFAVAFPKGIMDAAVPAWVCGISAALLAWVI